MGVNVQVCWDKFCRYWDVEPRLVPMEGERFHLTAEEAAKHCDENTIGVVAILGSTFDGSYEPVEEICAALDELAASGGPDVPVHVDGASGGFVAPFVQPDLVWDFQLPIASSRSTHRATSTGSSTPASAGRSGATRRRSRATWSSRSTTSAARCRRSRSTSRARAAR